MLKGGTTATVVLVLLLGSAAPTSATGPGTAGRWPPGARPPHPGMWPPFPRFHNPRFPMFHYPWGYPRIWYPPPYPPRFGFGWLSPGYRVPPSTRTRERCYHYFGQRYCVGGETYGDRPAEGQTPQEPDFGTGPRLFDGH